MSLPRPAGGVLQVLRTIVTAVRCFRRYLFRIAGHLYCWFLEPAEFPGYAPSETWNRTRDPRPETRLQGKRTDTMEDTLARLKQDYLSLPEAGRAAFDDFVRDERASHASATASAVVLSGGTGKKARLNGLRATLVAGSRRSGWVDVVAQGERVPWRQGGATAVGEATASGGALILLLADDQLVEIAKGLDTPSVCHYLRTSKRFGALEAGRCFTECHLREGLPRGYGVSESKQLGFARWLASVHAPIRTLHVDLGSGSAEGNVLRWVLQECDTHELTSVNIRIGQARFGQMTQALRTVSSYDLENGVQTEDAALNAQLEHFAGASPGLLTYVLAQCCPALSTLCINKQNGDVEDVPSLGSIKTLRHLEANLGEVP